MEGPARNLKLSPSLARLRELAYAGRGPGIAVPGVAERPEVRPMRLIAASVRTCLPAIAALLLSAPADSALAQPLMPLLGGVGWPGLSQDDLERMGAAAQRLYEGGSIGTVERWRNPDTKNAGEVKLTRSFEAQGMPCRTLDYTIRFDAARTKPKSYVLSWCKVPNDDWKIVELPRQR
jgi:surface antigen